MSVSLTIPQAAVLAFLRHEIGRDKVAPTVREIADRMGWKSIGATHRVLQALEQRGHIRRMPNTSRAIELVEPGSNKPLDVARDALVRVGADASQSNLDRVAGALCDCLRSAA